MKNDPNTSINDRRVLIFPSSVTFGSSGGRVFFLFSLTQIEDILKEITVVDVPFSPSYVEGIARWRNQVVPVLSLEGSLGLSSNGTSGSGERLVMVRSSVSFEGRRRRSLLRVMSAIRILTLPIACAPLSSVGWIPNSYLVRGVYKWEEGYLVVVHLENILSGR